jgi:hypothetical protein
VVSSNFEGTSTKNANGWATRRQQGAQPSGHCGFLCNLLNLLFGGSGGDSGQPSPSSISNADEMKIREFADQINKRNILANTAKIYGGSVVVGLTGGTACYYLCPEAATVTLAGETGTDLIEGTNTLNKIIGDSQRKLLQKFFRTGERPNGLSDRSLKIYKDIAQRAIQAGKDEAGVQAKRVKMIIDALK